MLFMIEPNRRDLLGDLTKGLPQIMVTEVHSFLRCVPWISLVLYGDIYEDETVRIEGCMRSYCSLIARAKSE